MNKYTIYCTEPQTQKALELGALIEAKYEDEYTPTCTEQKGLIHINKYWYIIPTAEEMIGWLEEQEEISDLHIFKPMTHWTFELYASNGDGKNNQPLFDTRREATLAAIDAALEYLMDNKE